MEQDLLEQDRLVAVWDHAVVTAVDTMDLPMEQVLDGVADLEAAVDSVVVGVLAGALARDLVGAGDLEAAMVAVTDGDFQDNLAITRARVLVRVPQVVTCRQDLCRPLQRNRKRL